MDNDSLVPDEPELNELPETPGPGAWQWDKINQVWVPITEE